MVASAARLDEVSVQGGQCRRGWRIEMTSDEGWLESSSQVWKGELRGERRGDERAPSAGRFLTVSLWVRDSETAHTGGVTIRYFNDAPSCLLGSLQYLGTDANPND
jgi:hypothetical protein